jgi:hypothetical protein
MNENKKGEEEGERTKKRQKDGKRKQKVIEKSKIYFK